MRTTFRLKDKDAKKETAIFVDIVHAGSRLKFYTDISIPPKFWSAKEERLKVPYADKDSDPFMKEYEENLNLKLSDIKAEFGQEMSIHLSHLLGYGFYPVQDFRRNIVWRLQ